eukprot:3691110-Amphidinium_carterae.1
MTVLRVVILDMRLVPTGCVIPLEPFAEFLMKFVVVVAAVLVLCLVHVATVAVKHNLKFRNHWAPLLGAVGTFASIVFIAVMSAALGPFRCFTHPNGKWTSGVYGSVVCWETAEHTRLYRARVVKKKTTCSAHPIPPCSLVEQLDMDFLRASFFVHSRFRPEVSYQERNPELNHFTLLRWGGSIGTGPLVHSGAHGSWYLLHASVGDPRRSSHRALLTVEHFDGVLHHCEIPAVARGLCELG